MQLTDIIRKLYTLEGLEYAFDTAHLSHPHQQKGWTFLASTWGWFKCQLVYIKICLLKQSNNVTMVYLFQCEVVFNNDPNATYSCVYVPNIEGTYRVSKPRGFYSLTS